MPSFMHFSAGLSALGFDYSKTTSEGLSTGRMTNESIREVDMADFFFLKLGCYCGDPIGKLGPSCETLPPWVVKVDRKLSLVMKVDRLITSLIFLSLVTLFSFLSIIRSIADTQDHFSWLLPHAI